MKFLSIVAVLLSVTMAPAFAQQNPWVMSVQYAPQGYGTAQPPQNYHVPQQAALPGAGYAANPPADQGSGCILPGGYNYERHYPYQRTPDGWEKVITFHSDCTFSLNSSRENWDVSWIGVFRTAGTQICFRDTGQRVIINGGFRPVNKKEHCDLPSSVLRN